MINGRVNPIHVNLLEELRKRPVRLMSVSFHGPGRVGDTRLEKLPEHSRLLMGGL